ncbi:MAG: DUF2202 domain-containing protein [Ignavibacteria bacterium]|jgi:hypothetical protein|nr:DUF2202 domain-containing protein [Ignavibacteria bacterium]
MKTIIRLFLTYLMLIPGIVISQPAITDSEKAAIIFVVQEEKVAHDFYAAMYELHGITPFRSISKSEGLHMDKAKNLIDHFGIEDPNTEYYDTPGKFKTLKFQAMYDDLVRGGSKSIQDALIESAKFEELDIVDIEKLISTVQNEYIKSTFGSLTGISKDHLKAIVRELSERGIEYSPSYLSKDELNSIVKSKDY